MDKHDSRTPIRSIQDPTAMIAIAGPSCSGKSTLLHALEAYWGPHNVATLPLDAYYRDLSPLPFEKRVTCNFDSPDAIDWPLLTTHLQQLGAGRAIERPVYDYATHTRTNSHVVLQPRRILIIEGIFSLWSEDIRKLAATRVYIDLPLEDCLARRIARDGRERARTEAQVREQFTRFVRPMAEQFVIPTREFANVVVRGDEPVKDSVERIAGFFEKRHAQA
jgi:uridine kinase